MEDLIKKWKTIIKNEKSNENQDLSQSSANFSRLKSSEKSNHLESSSLPQTNKSESLDRKNKFLKESNKDLRKKVRSSSKNNIDQPTFNLNNSNNFKEKNDEVIKKLNKIIKYLKKSTEIDKDDLISKLNEVIECHSEATLAYKASFKSFEENEIKYKAKHETTDKLIKDYESKYIVCEKEKVVIAITKNKLKKEYDTLLKEHEDLKEVTKTSGKNYELYKQIEESNKVLLKNNSTLLDNVNELKKRNEWIIQSYEEETQVIYQKLNTYKEKLNKLYSIYQINLNSEDNNCLNQENY